jgi:tetraacyldisaccharide-1-P 4'-kinase
MPEILVTITPIIVAVVRALFSRVARVFVFSRGFRGCSAFSMILFLNQLRDSRK